MKTHTLKIWPEYFTLVAIGAKPFEIRKNDRDFQIGDVLFLEEWDPFTKKHTGEVTTKQITYIIHGGQHGIDPGFVVMGICMHQIDKCDKCKGEEFRIITASTKQCTGCSKLKSS